MMLESDKHLELLCCCGYAERLPKEGEAVVI